MRISNTVSRLFLRRLSTINLTRRWKGSIVFETIQDGEDKSSRLTLSSTFNRQTKRLSAGVQQIRREGLNMYCCGPTVYADSHLGHAIAYIRCDLVKRALQTFLGLPIFMAMNITDIDDKILARAKSENIDYREVSQRYYQSFIQDLNSLGIESADCYLKVTDHIDVIIDYIQQLLLKGFAYHNQETGDINFDYETFMASFKITNARTNENSQQRGAATSHGKRSTKDFALWKASKAGEPSWELKLAEQVINGRPGWHVECSALSSYVFGTKLDIHFGGFDLIFPHHHCESCCSHAHDRLPGPDSNELYSSAGVWLHSGHLILRSEKMSKSLGNVVLIRDFLTKYSANLLRLLCIRTHYRSEIDFDEKLLQEMSAYDERLRELVNLIDFSIYKLSNGQAANDVGAKSSNLIAIDDAQIDQHQLVLPVSEVERDIELGVLNDLDLNVGLDAMLNLARRFPVFMAQASPEESDGHNTSKLLVCIRLKRLVDKWTEAMGLDYGHRRGLSSLNGATNLEMLEHFMKLRTSGRVLALEIMKNKHVGRLQDYAQQMLAQCDATRAYLEAHGYKLKDQSSKSTN